MSEKEDGGPAFPTTVWEERNGVQQGKPHDGMSLRDRFAIAALQGNHISSRSVEGIAQDAFKIADAMLKARKEGVSA